MHLATSKRTEAAWRETALLLRTNRCAADVMGLLNGTPLTADEIMVELKGRYSKSAIYAAIRLLRLTGLVEYANYKVPSSDLGFSKVWRAVREEKLKNAK